MTKSVTKRKERAAGTEQVSSMDACGSHERTITHMHAEKDNVSSVGLLLPDQ